MTDATRRDAPAVAVLGAGSIGVAFAVLFAIGGTRVRVWDKFPDVLDPAAADLRARLELLAAHGLTAEGVDEIVARVAFLHGLAPALAGVDLVQECAPEKAEVKRQLFREAVALAPDTAILASSSSALPPSSLASALGSAAPRVIVAHPGNPPYLLPVIEIVPSPDTRPEIVERSLALYRAAGLRPVLVRREVEGFVFNRLQGALLREAYCLVRDGVASVDDVDEVVRNGLGRRWSVIGPFETVDLNTRGGIESHADKMGPAYARMGAERGQHDAWTDELVATVTAARRAILPLERWEERVRWRDEQLMRLTPVWDSINLDR